jgi:iron complex transport system substrate-binding protein
MDRRTFLLSAGVVGLAFAAAGLSALAVGDRREPAGGTARLVSLSPGITETLFALGAGGLLVGRSTFCDFPPEVRSLPDAGTSLTPALERIAGLRPSAVLVEASAAASVDAVSRIAPTEVFPWLTVGEMRASVARLGATLGASAAAAALSDRLAVLDAEAPPDAPRVLLALATDDLGRAPTWYLRHGSLHGAALAAAGFRNAVLPDPPGPPQLPLERLIALDPDAIVVISATALDGDARRRVAGAFDALTPLAAVKSRRVAVLEGPEHLRTGPSILALVTALRDVLAHLGLQ